MQTLELPYFSIKVKAGFPSPALDYMEEKLDLNDIFIKHPQSTFIVECIGDSMIGAFIPQGAKLIVDRSLTPNNGDIVLAVVNGEFTVKFLKKNDYKCFLVPANKKYREIEITDAMNMQVWGVVTTIMTETKDVRKCML
ncbi:MAG TPA: translesion error-prone DNA polymerase V autoproteolytic subunit [Puia sp.]|nr:translesion error-prone DNA polymerase V autoproteolytic subunit [Puia sp.]